MDPDKIVNKLQKKREGVYQSKGHPEHFENEGAEFGAKDAAKSDNNKTKEEVDFDKIKGSKT